MKYAGTLGMCEMELAAERIMTVIKTENRTAGIRDMVTDSEKIGYVELAIRESLLQHGGYNGEFFPTPLFFKRIKEEPPAWKRYDVKPK